MTTAHTTGSLLPLLRELAADPGVVDALVDAARNAAPQVARLPVAESRRHVAVLFEAGLRAFERPADRADEHFGEAARLGADRAAQGVPLDALLCGVRAARTRVFEIAIERGRAAGVPHEVLLEAALELDRYSSTLERHVVDGYHAAEQRHRGDVRAVLLAGLLLGRSAAGVPADELARFGLHPTGRYHCVVSGPSGSDLRLARRVESRCGGLFGTVEGRLAGLAPRPPGAGAAGPGTLAVFAPATPLETAGTAYRLCVQAWEAGTRFGRRGLHAVADLAGETALAGQPELADLLRGALLGRLRPTDAFHRELASTALAYLDHGQRLDQTASALHVHPNTVRYRLRRLQELTGRTDDDQPLTVLGTLRWWWALRTWLDASGGDTAPGAPV